MDLTVKHSIANAVISALAAVIDAIQTKHKEEMFALQEMIEKKSLFLEDFSFSTFPSNPNASSKVLPPINLQSKATSRWNQSNLDYFNPHLDKKAYGVGKRVLVTKNGYYRNVILFVQRI